MSYPTPWHNTSHILTGSLTGKTTCFVTVETTKTCSVIPKHDTATRDTKQVSGSQFHRIIHPTTRYSPPVPLTALPTSHRPVIISGVYQTRGSYKTVASQIQELSSTFSSANIYYQGPSVCNSSYYAIVSSRHQVAVYRRNLKIN